MVNGPGGVDTIDFTLDAGFDASETEHVDEGGEVRWGLRLCVVALFGLDDGCVRHVVVDVNRKLIIIMSHGTPREIFYQPGHRFRARPPRMVFLA